jgi:hypothetical protein
MVSAANFQVKLKSARGIGVGSLWRPSRSTRATIATVPKDQVQRLSSLVAVLPFPPQGDADVCGTG